MTVKPACDYCWRPAIALVLPKRTVFNWRKRWRYVCGDHLRRGNWNR